MHYVGMSPPYFDGVLLPQPLARLVAPVPFGGILLAAVVVAWNCVQ